MARLRLEDLYAAIEAHPAYLAEWEDEVPARQSLRVRLVDELPPVRSEVFGTVCGRELIVDFDREGQVVAIEIA